MSTAAAARRAIRAHPFLLAALRAGVLNYSAAARFLELDDVEAGAAALRRLGNEETEVGPREPELRIRIERDVPAALADSLESDQADLRAIVATGSIASMTVARIVARFDDADVDLLGMTWTPDRLTIAVASSSTATALRCVEGRTGSTD